MQFGERLKEQRKKKNLTQDDVAHKLNVSRQTISSWENENSYPDIRSLVQLSDLYSISLDTMLKEDHGMREFIQKNTLQHQMVGLTSSIYALYILATPFYMTFIIYNNKMNPHVFHLLGYLVCIMAIVTMSTFRILMKRLGMQKTSPFIHQNKIITYALFAMGAISIALWIFHNIYIPAIITFIVYEIYILIYYFRNR